MSVSKPPDNARSACDHLASLLVRAEQADPSKARFEPETIFIPQARYARALIDQRLRPALDSGFLTADPVHVVMFGGTNSGKSTVLNLLLGRPAAGMSFRARFSQHPEAYRLAALGNRFLDAHPTRFAGYARYHDRHPPRQEDDDLRQHGYKPALALNDPTHLHVQPAAPPASSSVVFWDIPDFSTEEAQIYLPAVLETLAIADLVVMTVTRENYADHRGRLLRTLILDSGVPLFVVANKLEPGSTLIEDIRRKLVPDKPESSASLPADRVLPIPQVVAESEDARLARLIITPEAVELRRRIAAETALGPALKRTALDGATRFLERRLDETLAPLHAALQRRRAWAERVDHVTRVEFLDRYRRDYLDGERYVDFNLTLVKLMDLLEIPGIGPIISGVSRGLRSASRWVIGTVSRGVRGLLGIRSPERRGPELDVVALAFERWIEALRGEAQALATRHSDPAWPAIACKLSNVRFLNDFGDSLGAAYLEYRDQMDRLTAERARTLFNLISGRPAVLNALRGMKMTLDVGTTALIVSSGGLDWTDAVVGPLVVPLQRIALQAGLDQYLNLQKSQLKQEQFAAFAHVVDVRMVRPVHSLYPVAIEADALARARGDAQALAQALRLV